MTSTRSTMPAPPPNGVSSTWRALSGEWSRGFSARTSWPAATALRMWRWLANHSNQSGKSVMTSSCTSGRRSRSGARVAVGREVVGQRVPEVAEVDVDDAATDVDAPHAVAHERHQHGRASFAPRDLERLARRQRHELRDDADRAVAVDDAQADEVLGVPLVLVERRRRGARDGELGAAQRLGRLPRRDAGEPQDRAIVGPGAAHDLRHAPADANLDPQREQRRPRPGDVEGAVEAVRAPDPTRHEPVAAGHRLVDDVDEDAALLAHRGGLDDGAQRVGGAPAAPDDLPVVVVGDGQLEDDRAVVLLELLDGHLVGMRDEHPGELLEEVAHA